MTTTTEQIKPTTTVPSGHYHLVGLLSSEWTKLRTVRSTMWTLAITIVLAWIHRAGRSLIS